MGISVSASAAVIFIGVFVAAGILYPTVQNGTERVSAAHQGAADRVVDEENTGIDTFNATYYASNDTLVVEATNTGTTTINATAANLLVNNSLVDASTEVEGNADTHLWLPGEEAEFTVSGIGDPTADGRATLVVEHGLSDGLGVFREGI
jgi:flagellar protein FlaF